MMREEEIRARVAPYETRVDHDTLDAACDGIIFATQDIPYLLAENARLRKREDMFKEMAKNAMERTKTLFSENARLRVESEAAKRDLTIIPTICYGDCSGDPAVGVPDCPFFDWVEDDKVGYREATRQCRYMTPDTAQNIFLGRATTLTNGTLSDERSSLWADGWTDE